MSRRLSVSAPHPGVPCDASRSVPARPGRVRHGHLGVHAVRPAAGPRRRPGRAGRHGRPADLGVRGRHGRRGATDGGAGPPVAAPVGPAGVPPPVRGGPRGGRHDRLVPPAVRLPGGGGIRQCRVPGAGGDGRGGAGRAGPAGRAVGVLLSGTTAATVAGVPAGALLGQLLGWRASFWAVAVLCAPAAVGVLLGVPGGRGSEGGRPALRAELAELGRPRLLRVLLLGALVNAGTFAAFTFLAPVVTGPAGLGRGWVPPVLVLFGAGTMLGVAVAGRLADRHPGRLLAVAGPLLPLGWTALAAFASRPAALLVLVPLLGALSFAVGGTLITRALATATGAPTMAGAYATAALNLGAATGPLLAAATLPSPTGPLRAAAALTVAAVLLGLLPRAGAPAKG
ncbi:hypothetical protein KCH_11370 [Kitasatospora cheerisanensis KCTC 2395]|uniref:Major facilitator superfamily (MFS) profile domain-containing protein n=1 Tax=Kitasatospora cheerisanensis KCTC 2395 TaxID=1348663 RepID=A0A066Z0M4_9ACTN|nr:hypothetical protein KCH_11370 [Kitasatospora cheerisanensis KCTC 2395]